MDGRGKYDTDRGFNGAPVHLEYTRAMVAAAAAAAAACKSNTELI